MLAFIIRRIAQSLFVMVVVAMVGEFGLSYRHRRPVAELFKERLPATLELSFIAALFSLMVGVPMGVCTGLHKNGMLDAAIMRIAESQLNFPAILITLLVDGITRTQLPGAHTERLAIFVLAFSIGISGWVQYARTTRSSTMVEKSREYVQASRVIDIHPVLIMLRRVLPNVMGPVLVIADEPISALDVSLQAQILNLMKDLQQELGLFNLFISHDLAVVRHMAHGVGVMYLGKMCETAPVDVLFDHPRHPYTRMLLDTIPDIEMTGRTKPPASGEIPNPIDPTGGCAFHPRCPLAEGVCRITPPSLETVDTAVRVACHRVPGSDRPRSKGYQKTVV